MANAPDSMAHIREMPTTHDCEGKYDKYHESTLRAWNILRYVEWLLERGTPADVVIALIKDMEAK